MCCRSFISLTERFLNVLKVLQQLPEGLAIAVLTSSPADLEQHISILPSSLHPLAVEAAFPSIRRDHSLTLDFASLTGPMTAYTVLHAATAGSTAACDLQEVKLKQVPTSCNQRLQQVISATCRSASDVSLDFGCSDLQLVPEHPPFLQLSEVLSHNSALTNLQLSFVGDPCLVIDLDYMFQSLAGLRSLALTSSRCRATVCSTDGLPAPRCITSLIRLTHLSLGPGFHLRDMPQIVPHMTRLQALHLKGYCELQKLLPLDTLAALQTLQLHVR
jgi:hypothetical protein